MTPCNLHLQLQLQAATLSNAVQLSTLGLYTDINSSPPQKKIYPRHTFMVSTFFPDITGRRVFRIRVNEIVDCMRTNGSSFRSAHPAPQSHRWPFVSSVLPARKSDRRSRRHSQRPSLPDVLWDDDPESERHRTALALKETVCDWTRNSVTKITTEQ